MRKAAHHLRRPFAIKRTWAGLPAFSPPAVFDGTRQPHGRQVRTKLVMRCAQILMRCAQLSTGIAQSRDPVHVAKNANAGPSAQCALINHHARSHRR